MFFSPDYFKAWLEEHGFKREGDLAHASYLVDTGKIMMREFTELLATVSGQSVPHEAIFIDDNLSNVMAAKELGMYGEYLNLAQLREDLAGIEVWSSNKQQSLQK